MFKKVLTAGSVALLPFVALAQQIDTGYFTDFLNSIESLVSTAIPVLIGIAVLYFIYGLVSYVVSSDDDKKKEARGIMIYGVIIIAVMVSIWGLVGLLQDIFLGGSSFQTPDAPGIPDSN